MLAPQNSTSSLRPKFMKQQNISEPYGSIDFRSFHLMIHIPVAIRWNMPSVVNGSVSVVPHALVNGDLMVSDAVAIPSDDVVTDAQKKSATEDPATASQPSSASGSGTLVAHRWLQKYLDKPKGGSGQGDKGGSAASGDRQIETWSELLT